MPPHERASPAFSLIEVLIAVAIIGVLVALAAPALRGVRARGGEAVALSNLRGVGVALDQYRVTYGGWNPWAPPLSPLPAVPPDEGGTILMTNDPWVLSYAWPTLFHATAPWSDHYRSWMNPPRGRDGSRPWLSPSSAAAWPSYVLTRSFFARPAAWAEGGAPADLIGATGEWEILFPSSKAAGFDEDRAYLRRPARPDDARGVLAADGAAAMRLDSAARPPVQNHVTDHPPAVYHDTAEGVRGVDF